MGVKSKQKTSEVYNKYKTLLVHWSSKIPINYKSNLLIGELHRAERMIYYAIMI